ncbi:hypothetical protein [Succinivibrio dextrinosolvens]|jgi:hypothetical protein|uniref:type III secretion apparatus assembly protein SctX n=1 Tax=Succinivibrio dextrinosolvens TaxID=83771 RepID=UPI0024200CFB|nr:hypothetical protein [Succinivibrio dextrinosolvens]MBE6422392.1 hypothetical protein [Succinivibrio dextrinosolvens]
MATRISGNSSLLNSNFGLDQVLDRPTTQSHLPKNMSYVPVGNTNVRLENMYKKSSVDKRMMSKAKPNIDNPDELDPANFAMNFENAVEKLAEFDTPATNDFSQEVADPLLENQLLLKIYKGFMVGG